MTTLTAVDGRFVLRFELTLAHPVDRVWRAVVEPEENRHWYPCRAEFDLRPGGAARFTWGGGEVTRGVVQEADEPRLLAFDEDGHVVRYELTPSSEGTSLVFTHAFDDRAVAERTAAGWHRSLDGLELHLAGEPTAAAFDGDPAGLVEEYRAAFA